MLPRVIFCLLFGNAIFEATIPLSVTIIMRQFSELPVLAIAGKMAWYFAD
jgi:hypothetical protein